MDNLSSQLTKLQKNLESAAFLVSRGNSEQDTHAKIVQSLVHLSQIESQVSQLIKEKGFECADTPKERTSAQSNVLENHRTSVMNNAAHNEITNEIEKVKRKVPRWFNKPNQLNSTILNYFLELSKTNSQVTLQMLRNKCQDMNRFDGNYNQMKNFGEKNHGKVFEESDNIIILWEPVKEFILGLYYKK